jgi:ferredoxin
VSRTSRYLRVEPITCHAHGICRELLPELIRLDEWGYPIVEDGPVPASLHTAARAAVHACPSLALRLDRPEPGTQM